MQQITGSTVAALRTSPWSDGGQAEVNAAIEHLRQMAYGGNGDHVADGGVVKNLANEAEADG